MERRRKLKMEKKLAHELPQAKADKEVLVPTTACILVLIAYIAIGQ